MVNEALLTTLSAVERNDSIYAYLSDELGSTVYTFLFNPESKAVSLRANYKEGAAAITSLPSQSYQYTSGQTLELNNLILESWSRGKSIKPLLDSLVGLTRAEPSKGKYAPSTVTFIWGGNKFGPAVITSLDWTETAWLGGEPASAKLNMKLLQVPSARNTLTAQQRIEAATATEQSLTARQKLEATNKAKVFLQSNLKTLSTSTGQLVRSGNYKLTVSDTGIVTMTDPKGKALGVVGTYRNGKFTNTGRTLK
ncbi:hypothetical protein CLI64_11040 [Nostoc sp. CENA543]|uniref:CIS tube protein n=1 Tax=Nostoc sp. CENA543 TaxID=1869241 RepID=UPI000CA28357|nr:hypothetical protein CLI64_11040 [Nostoc sp. CENA543]